MVVADLEAAGAVLADAFDAVSPEGLGPHRPPQRRGRLHRRHLRPLPRPRSPPPPLGRHAGLRASSIRSRPVRSGRTSTSISPPLVASCDAAALRLADLDTTQPPGRSQSPTPPRITASASRPVGPGMRRGGRAPSRRPRAAAGRWAPRRAGWTRRGRRRRGPLAGTASTTNHGGTTRRCPAGPTRPGSPGPDGRASTDASVAMRAHRASVRRRSPGRWRPSRVPRWTTTDSPGDGRSARACSTTHSVSGRGISTRRSTRKVEPPERPRPQDVLERLAGQPPRHPTPRSGRPGRSSGELGPRAASPLRRSAIHRASLARRPPATAPTSTCNRRIGRLSPRRRGGGPARRRPGPR